MNLQHWCKTFNDKLTEAGYPPDNIKAVIIKDTLTIVCDHKWGGEHSWAVEREDLAPMVARLIDLPRFRKPSDVVLAEGWLMNGIALTHP